MPPPKNRPRGGVRQPCALEALARLPLVEAFDDLWAFLASAVLLDARFARYRGRCYDERLRFPERVEVFADALTRYDGSGRPAIIQAIQRNALPWQQRAVYRNLARLPWPLAEAFFATRTAQRGGGSRQAAGRRWR